MGLTGHSGLRRRTAGTPSAVQNPFSPGSVSNRDLSSGRRNEESSSEGAILDAPFVSSVMKKGGTLQHPVINLANFNKFVIYSHFKMEDLKTVSDLLRPWDFKCKLYLRDAYFTIPLHTRSRNSPASNSEGERVNSLVSHSG